MKFNKHFFLLSLLLLSLSLSAQSFKAYKKAGDEAFKQKDLNAAMHYYAEALAKKEDAEVYFRYALVAKDFYALELAEKYFKKALKLDKEQQLYEALFYLGMVKKQLGEYTAAIEYFNDFRQDENASRSSFFEESEAQIKACASAKMMQNAPEKVSVKPLKKGINTAYSEFGALQRGDTLYYTSYCFENKNDTHDPPRKISKELISIEGKSGKILRRGFNSKEQNTAHTTFSIDGKRLYFNICTYQKGVNIRCELYYREKDSRKRWKKTAVLLPKSINLENFTATQPSIGFDSLEMKEMLYFVSDRPGGKGGLDIWKVEVKKGRNKFGKPELVKNINGNADDITPFFDTSSQGLYFSSNRIGSMGGFDVFRWNMKDSIRHLLPPVNSSYSDLYYVVNEDGETGFLSSNRPGSLYLDKKNKACCNDLYQFEPIPEVFIDSFQIVDKEVVIVKKEIVEDKIPETLQDFLPLALYFDNDEPDKRTRRQTTKKNYQKTYLKYFDKKALFIENFAAPIEEERQEEAAQLVDRFFEETVQKGYRHLFLFSDILLKRLEKGEKVEIFIKGFTSPRAQSNYNLSLGKRRISCLKNHFADYGNGIFETFISSGQLKITERSFGETSADEKVSDALEDLRNSIYSPAASRERRVEIVEIEIEK